MQVKIEAARQAISQGSVRRSGLRAALGKTDCRAVAEEKQQPGRQGQVQIGVSRGRCRGKKVLRGEKRLTVSSAAAIKGREGAAGLHMGALEGSDQSSLRTGEEATPGSGGIRAGLVV